MCPTLLPALFLLPTEMIVAILRYLDGNSLENIALTNKRLMQICKGDPFLRKKIRAHLVIQNEETRQEVASAYLENEGFRKEISNILAKYGGKVNTVGPNAIRIDALPGIGNLSVLGNNKREAGRMQLQRKKYKARKTPYRNLRC